MRGRAVTAHFSMNKKDLFNFYIFAKFCQCSWSLANPFQSPTRDRFQVNCMQNKVVLLYTEVESIVFVNEAKTINADVVSNINKRISFGCK